MASTVRFVKTGRAELRICTEMAGARPHHSEDALPSLHKAGAPTGSCISSPGSPIREQLGSWSSFTAGSNFSSMEEWSDEDTRTGHIHPWESSPLHPTLDGARSDSMSSGSHTDLLLLSDKLATSTRMLLGHTLPASQPRFEAAQHHFQKRCSRTMQRGSGCVPSDTRWAIDTMASSEDLTMPLAAAADATLGCSVGTPLPLHSRELTGTADSVDCFDFTQILSSEAEEDELALLTPADKHLPFDICSSPEVLPKSGSQFTSRWQVQQQPGTARDTQDLLMLPASRLMCEADRYNPFHSICHASDEVAALNALFAADSFYDNAGILAADGSLEMSSQHFDDLEHGLEMLPDAQPERRLQMLRTADTDDMCTEPPAAEQLPGSNAEAQLRARCSVPELSCSSVLGDAATHPAAAVCCAPAQVYMDAVELLDAVCSNSETFELQGRVLNLGLYLPSAAPESTLDAVLDALLLNTRVQCLYLPAQCQAFGEVQMRKLTRVLQQRHIWALNMDNSSLVDMELWARFVGQLPSTALAYLCIPKDVQTRAAPELKTRIKEVLMANRARSGAEHSADVLAYMFEATVSSQPGAGAAAAKTPSTCGTASSPSCTASLRSQTTVQPRSLRRSASAASLQNMPTEDAAPVECSKRQSVATKKRQTSKAAVRKQPTAKKQKLSRAASLHRIESSSSAEFAQLSAAHEGGPAASSGEREVASRTKPSFMDLVAKGMVTPGEHEFSVGGIPSVVVDVLPSGVILYNAETYNSISSFALAAARSRNPSRQACDGWKEVRWQGLRLEKLRCRYIELYMS